jgi:hypothetical protein
MKQSFQKRNKKYKLTCLRRYSKRLTRSPSADFAANDPAATMDPEEDALSGDPSDEELSDFGLDIF